MLTSFRDRLSDSHARSESKQRRRNRPRVEMLEVRSLLSTFVDLGQYDVTGINASQEIIGNNGGSAFLLGSNGVSTNLGILPGYTSSFATALNDSGQVVGYSQKGTGGLGGDLTNTAFLYSNGTLTDLGTLGGADSVATGINASGQIVGYSTTTTGATHAFLYSSGKMTDLGTLGANGSQATGINASGQVVGYLSFTPAIGDSYSQAFIDSGGTMTDLANLVGQDSQANAINMAGDIVGDSTQAFLYSDGNTTELGPLPGYTESTAAAINDSGEVVGYSDNGGLGATGHAFLYQDNIMTDLNSLPEIPSKWTLETATAINNNGVIVGMGSNGTGQAYELFTSPSGGTGPAPGGTSTSLDANSLSPVYGESITLSAAVSPASGASGTPTGSVTFYDGATELGAAPLIGGSATLSVGNLPVGTDAITASYGGDSQFGVSTSSTVNVTVGQDGTSVSLTPSANPAQTNQQITFTAVVSPLAPGRGDRNRNHHFQGRGGGAGHGHSQRWRGILFDQHFVAGSTRDYRRLQR